MNKPKPYITKIHELTAMQLTDDNLDDIIASYPECEITPTLKSHIFFLKSEHYIGIIEVGDWLVCEKGEYCVHLDGYFNENYEEANR